MTGRELWPGPTPGRTNQSAGAAESAAIKAGGLGRLEAQSRKQAERRSHAVYDAVAMTD